MALPGSRANPGITWAPQVNAELQHETINCGNQSVKKGKKNLGNSRDFCKSCGSAGKITNLPSKDSRVSTEKRKSLILAAPRLTLRP